MDDDEVTGTAAPNEAEVDAAAQAAAAAAQGETPEPAANDEAAADEEVVISIGDPPAEPTAEEEQHQQAPEWVRELRRQQRELQKKNRDLEQQLAAAKQTSAKPATVELGAKPTLEACDFDAEKFERDLEAWHERKREVDAQQRKQQEAQAEAQKAWQARQDQYAKAKTALKVRDFDEAEDAVKDALSVTQQGIVLHGLDSPEIMVYALGKNPDELKRLASITDPVKFAVAVAKLETKLKVTPRKIAPPPERVVRGSVPGALGGPDATLDRLEAEAEKTGDRSKIIAYKRQKRQQQAA